MLNSVINTGELNDVLVIQQKVEETDENGFPMEEYADLYRLRCKKKTLNSQEFVKSDKDSTKVTLKFICRKREINNKMIILYRGTKFNILNIHELDPYFVEITADMIY